MVDTKLGGTSAFYHLKTFKKSERIKFVSDESQNSAPASTMNESTSSGQQDWSAVWECFESPHRLLSMPAGGLSKGMQVTHRKLGSKNLKLQLEIRHKGSMSNAEIYYERLF